jgi:hypothetical protein
MRLITVLKDDYICFDDTKLLLQDRIMISITTMQVVATIQASIDKMVPKTSYLKGHKILPRQN